MKSIFFLIFFWNITYGMEKNDSVNLVLPCPLDDSKALANQINQTGLFPLHEAVINCKSVEVIRTLIEHGANINRAAVGDENKSKTPLHYAAFCNNFSEIIEELIMQGADVNSMDDDGNSPLHCAIQGRYPAITVKAIFEAVTKRAIQKHELKHK